MELHVPKDGHPRFSDQLLTLACHVLAPYQAPPALCSAWFMGTDEEGQAAQDQFLHVARGGSIRDLDLPIKLTKRMAHVFQRAPLYSSIEKSLRWTQVIGMISIFVTSIWGMYRNLDTGALGG